MRPFDGRRVILGVTGGIACYKAVTLARLLTQAGAVVDVILSRAAREFVGPITFEAVTGRPVAPAILDAGHALAHIRLAKEAELVIVAPATADLLARAGQGRADDQLTAVLLATRAPVLVAPAMNDGMWAHALVRRNVQVLRELGHNVLDPDTGPLAFGEGVGPGRMCEPEEILAHAGRLLETARGLAGRHIVVTAGPTREALDPVRYITNHSSGRMGVAIANAAWRRGAAVTLVHGPLEVPLPWGGDAIAVTSTTEMRDAVAAALPAADALVMAAAPADFRPTAVEPHKIKKGDTAPVIALEHTEDILASTRAFRRPGAVIMGFALETTSVEQHAMSKLHRKGLDFIVANDATEEGAGFGTDTNRVVILDAAGGREVTPVLPKSVLADLLLDRVSRLLEARHGGGTA
ncbi:MAG: bifunctional phosphopantothenoylcysteine decarboxylase/phosphopantothenate--cysteine ligase CoaBC [Gemmatimonadaceae bacterium]|nr:bifunctional phosphopantothenoylcysteine decarboxylase/phosphopantothenate--cysteine ligase CoaBC [Gemmatimonadaceae bacterium]